MPAATGASKQGQSGIEQHYVGTRAGLPPQPTCGPRSWCILRLSRGSCSGRSRERGVEREAERRPFERDVEERPSLTYRWATTSNALRTSASSSCPRSRNSRRSVLRCPSRPSPPPLARSRSRTIFSASDAASVCGRPADAEYMLRSSSSMAADPPPPPPRGVLGEEPPKERCTEWLRPTGPRGDRRCAWPPRSSCAPCVPWLHARPCASADRGTGSGASAESRSSMRASFTSKHACALPHCESCCPMAPRGALRRAGPAPCRGSLMRPAWRRRRRSTKF